MEKKIVRCRIRVKATYDSVTFCEMTTYGAQINDRTIVADNYTFHAGRKAGFGKSAYIYKVINKTHCKVIIDRIEVVA